MAAFSLLSSNCSALNLCSLHNSPVLLPSIPHRRITIIVPSSRCRRSLIYSAMQPSISESSTISSAGNPLKAQTATTNGLNLQMLSSVNFPSWAKFALGSLVLLAMSFCRKTMRLRDVIKTVEMVVETVETVAEETEKVAVEVAQVLPNGWLKEAAVELERISLLVDKSAEATESIIDKVEDVVEVFDTTLSSALIGGHIELDGDKKEDKETTNIITPTKNSVQVITAGPIKSNDEKEGDEVPANEVMLTKNSTTTEFALN